MRSLQLFTLLLATFFTTIHSQDLMAQIESHLSPDSFPALAQAFALAEEHSLVNAFAGTASIPCSETLTSTITVMKTITLPVPTSVPMASLDMSLDIFIPAITAASEWTVSSSSSPTTFVSSQSTAPGATGIGDLPFFFRNAASNQGPGIALLMVALLSSILLIAV